MSLIEAVAKDLFEAEHSSENPIRNRILFGMDGPITWDFATSPHVAQCIPSSFRERAKRALLSAAGHIEKEAWNKSSFEDRNSMLATAETLKECVEVG